MNKILKIYDPYLFLVALLATVLGIFFIFDAGYARSMGKGQGVLSTEFRMQIAYAGASLVLGRLVAELNPSLLKKAARPLWIASLLMLLAVERFGQQMNGATRWIKITEKISIQPAEFSKLATVLYLAYVFSSRAEWPKEMKPTKHWGEYMDRVVVPKALRMLPALYVLFSVYLINHEHDLGTASVVAATAFAMFFPGRVSTKSIVAALCIGLLGAVFLAKQEPYRMERIMNHARRWESDNMDDTGYQTVQAELHQASGGVLGVGLGAGHAKQILPATTTDFIMATIGEECGLWGSLGVLGVLGVLVGRLLFQAQRVTSRFSMLVLYGVAIWIGVQTTVNVMMANAFLPAIGIPLPFISSGGSSLIALWLAMGACQAALAPVPVKKVVGKAAVHAAKSTVAVPR